MIGKRAVEHGVVAAVRYYVSRGFLNSKENTTKFNHKLLKNRETMKINPTKITRYTVLFIHGKAITGRVKAKSTYICDAV